MINFNEISAISKTWNYRKTEDRNGTEDSFTIPEYSEKLKLKKIGGKSVVWNQMVNLIDRTYTSHGVIMTSATNGSIILNGTADTNMSDSNCGLSFPMIGGHKYFFTGYNGYENSGVAISDTKSYSTVQNDRIYTASSSADSVKLNVYITSGSTFENVTLYPKCIDLTKLFGAGNEPTSTSDPRVTAIKKYLETHPEYNEGEIIDSLVDEIEVDGVNLFDKNTGNTINGYLNGTTITTDITRKIIYLPCESNTTYRLRKLAVSNNECFVGGCIDSLPTVGMTIYNRVAIPSQTEIGNELSINITTGSNTKYIVAWVSWDNYWNRVKETLQISKGSAAYPYKPYHTPKIITTNFPSLKSAGSVYDYIDFTSAVKLPSGDYNVNVIRNVGQVDLGSLSWRYSSPTEVFFSTNLINGVAVNTATVSNLLCIKYTASKRSNLSDKQISYHKSDAFYTTIKDTNYTDATEFKNSLQGKILYYELATPTTETITISAELLEWLKVEYGGNMYYKQDTLSLPIPNTTNTHKHIEKTEELSQIVIDDEVVWSSPVSMFNLYDDDIIIDEETPTDEETPIDEDEVIEDGE